MSALPHTAFLLAAGKGTRMRPLTLEVPKPLIEVAGRSMLDRLLDALVAAGVRRAVVNVHWLADQVETHLAARRDIEIVISDERDALLETGGALAKAAPLLGADPVFILNTDAIWGTGGPEPLNALAAGFDPDRMDELLLLADHRRALGFGGPGDFFRTSTGEIAHRGTAETAPWAFAAVRIADPKRFSTQSVEAFSAFRYWTPSLEAGRLYGLVLDDFWLHVGDPDALADAEMWMRCHGQ